MFKPDIQIKRKPACEVCGKEESGWILLAGKLVCGECMMKYENKKNMMILEAVKNG